MARSIDILSVLASFFFRRLYGVSSFLPSTSAQNGISRHENDGEWHRDHGGVIPCAQLCLEILHDRYKDLTNYLMTWLVAFGRFARCRPALYKMTLQQTPRGAVYVLARNNIVPLAQAIAASGRVHLPSPSVSDDAHKAAELRRLYSSGFPDSPITQSHLEFADLLNEVGDILGTIVVVPQDESPLASGGAKENSLSKKFEILTVEHPVQRALEQPPRCKPKQITPSSKKLSGSQSSSTLNTAALTFMLTTS
jgi:hypothetical protein